MSSSKKVAEPSPAPHSLEDCEGRVNRQAEVGEPVESLPAPSTYRLRRRTPGSFVLVSCPQIGRALKCQGQLEAAAAVILAGCPELQSVREQPAKIWYLWHDTADGLKVQILDTSKNP